MDFFPHAILHWKNVRKIPLRFLVISCFVVSRASFSGAANAAESLEQLRSEVRTEFGIVALDKTDKQSPAVLRNLLFLLRHAFPPGFARGLGNLHYLYAYAGHDGVYDLGAFHPEAKAISVGGALTYAGGGIDPRLLATLAHELGHAFLLAKLTPRELRGIAEVYGGWDARAVSGGFYARDLFTPRKYWENAEREPVGDLARAWREKSACSRLANRNIHEWFAEAFAARALQRLGERGFLGAGWRALLVAPPRHPREFWWDYNLLGAGFSSWLDARVGLR
jgi:hypothetical protein